MKLSDEVVQFLNNFQAGNLLVFVIGCCATIASVYTLVKKYLAQHDEQVLKEDEKQEQLVDLLNDLSTLHGQFDETKKSFETGIKQVVDEIDDMKEHNKATNESIEESFVSMKDTIEDHGKTISELEDKLVNVDARISLLLRSDRTYFRTFIINSHSRFTKSGEIDLISLQGLEDMYSKYIESSNGTADEFIAKLMKEIRSLRITGPSGI